MKLRISSCKAALAKDLTRFAPAWGLYLVGFLLLMLPELMANSSASIGMTLGESIGALGVLNFVYAALCAQLLFGDLFQSRLCNALHAMPIKRSGWFFCHVAAGLSFSLVPNTICALILMPLMKEFWFVSLLWLAALTLEFMFFFGLGVLSMLCTGNRFAMVAVYGILNFLSILVLWFVKTIFEPLLYGFYVTTEPFFWLCPVVQLVRGQTVGLEYIFINKIGGTWMFTGLGEGWIYLLVLAGAGTVFGVLALLLYRKRALESAGDFIAFRPLAPVFCVVYTLTVAALFAMWGELFFGKNYLFFPVGFLVGYFTGQMLLRRTVKVFTGRVFLWFAVFAVAVFASVGLVRVDPAGYTYWVPRPAEVESVKIANSKDAEYYYNWLELTEPEDIAAITELHRDVTEKLGKYPNGNTTCMSLTYTLKNGRKVTRAYEYGVPVEPLMVFFSRPACVLGLTGDTEAFLDSVPFVEIESKAVTGEKARELLLAMIADCEAGAMAQDWTYHDFKNDRLITWVAFQPKGGDYRDVMVFTNAENTVRWLKENFDLWADEEREPEDYFSGK